MANRCLAIGDSATSEHLLSNEWADANEIKAVLGLPLIADGGPIGSLLVYSNEWEAFDEKETELMQQAANDVAQGIVLLRARIARLRAEEALQEDGIGSRTRGAGHDNG